MQQPTSQKRIPLKKESVRHDTIVIIRRDTITRTDTIVVFQRDSTVFEKIFARTDTVNNRSIIPIPIPLCLDHTAIVFPSSPSTLVTMSSTPEPSSKSFVMIGFIALFLVLYLTRGRKH